MDVLLWMLAHPDLIYQSVVALHILAIAVVNLTPTPRDNAILAKFYPIVEAVAGLYTTTAKQLTPKQEAKLK